MPKVECARCGFAWEIKSVRSPEVFCWSCRSRKVQTVHGKLGKCIPWAGRFAEDFATPIDDDGLVVMPGVRLCGKSDCVSPRHVVPYERNSDGQESGKH